MSRYCEIKTIFQDGDALVCALLETGNWTIEQIEVHSEPQNLRGYRGDLRSEKANIIIRRKHVGSSSNDLGFIKNEYGTYQAIVSEYDSGKYGAAFIGQLTGNYAFHKVRVEQESRGRSVSRERLPGGRQRVRVVGYGR